MSAIGAVGAVAGIGAPAPVGSNSPTRATTFVDAPSTSATDPRMPSIHDASRPERFPVQRCRFDGVIPSHAVVQSIAATYASNRLR